MKNARQSAKTAAVQNSLKTYSSEATKEFFNSLTLTLHTKDEVEQFKIYCERMGIGPNPETQV